MIKELLFKEWKLKLGSTLSAILIAISVYYLFEGEIHYKAFIGGGLGYYILLAIGIKKLDHLYPLGRK